MRRGVAIVLVLVATAAGFFAAFLLFGGTCGDGSQIGKLLCGGWQALKTGFATAILTGAIAGAVVGLRWIALEVRRRAPRMQVMTFEWTGKEMESQPQAAWITSLFRNQLSALQLDALDALPERAPGAALVEIIAGVGQGSAVGKVLTGLFKTAFPPCAYTVWGTLRPHSNLNGGYISVELVDRARGDKTLISVTCESSDWGACTHEAAMTVAGALYPCVAPRHKGPWTKWTEPVPRQLVMRYHDGATLEHADRIEEALGAYEQARRQDPLNPHLRIRMAMLQERLGLYLDAWQTYQAITTETERSGWSGRDRRVHLVALYRLAIILGYGKVGDQWMREEQVPRTKRDEERRRLRAELAVDLVSEPLFGTAKRRRAWLIDRSPRRSRPDGASAETLWCAYRRRLKRLGLKRIPTTAKDIDANGRLLIDLLCSTDPTHPDRLKQRWERDEVREVPNGDRSVERVHLINELFQILALRHLEELRRWMSPWPRLHDYRRWWRRRPPLAHVFVQREIAPAAIELAFVCLRLRLCATKLASRRKDEARQDQIREAYARLLCRPPFQTWDRLPAQSRRLRHRRMRKHRDEWLIHYNAACTAAVPLLPGHPKVSMGRNVLVETAVAHLENYASRAGSARVASQEGWIGSEDPDLAGLTEHPAFRRWARHHLHQPLPIRRPLRNVDVARQLRLVLARGAQLMVDQWRERALAIMAPDAGSPPPDVRRPLQALEVERWWREERELWTGTLDACRDFRSWRQRLVAFEAVNSRLVAASEEEFNTALSWRERTGDGEDYHRFCLRDTVNSVQPDGNRGWATPTSVLDWVEGRRRHVEAVIERGAVEIGAGLDAHEELDAALRAARLWARFAKVVDPSVVDDAVSADRDQDPAMGEKTFQAALDALRREVHSLPRARRVRVMRSAWRPLARARADLADRRAHK